MTILIVLSYAFGGLALMSLIIAYQQKQRKNLIFNKLFADGCWTVHYLLIGAYGGMIPNLVGIFREIIFVQRENKNWANNILIPIFFVLITWVIGYFTFDNLINLLPITASTFVTVSLWLKKPKLTKIILMPVCVSFVIYDFFVHSYIGAFCSSVEFISIVFNFVKEYFNKKGEKMNKIFSEDFITYKKPVYIAEEPIRDYSVFIEPHKQENAIRLGEKFVKEMEENFIADFEKNEEYCKNHGGNVDQMCHVSTFVKIDGKTYMTYYANESSGKEDPAFQVARLAFMDDNDKNNMTIIDVQKVGDKVGEKTVDKVYDTILLYDGGDEIFILWTASLDQKYYRLVRTFNIKNNTLGKIQVNRLKVNDVINDFSTSGIESALAENGILQKKMIVDIGIMQKLSTRIENGVKYYYSGAYSGYLNFIIKTTDFITWEYVSTPDFVNLSMWENATYVIDDKVFYFVRQRDCNQGFLTYCDLINKKWSKPVIIADCQSRSDFFLYKDDLYLVNAPLNREGIAITKIDRTDISKSKPIVFANLKSSIFYPFTKVYNNDLHISYTVDRKHIRLTKVNLQNYL